MKSEKVFAKFDRNMAEDAAPKRKRVSTGGTAEDMSSTNRSYALAAAPDIRTWSDSRKLDFLIEQVCVTQSLTAKIHQVTAKLDQAYQVIDEMQIHITGLEDRVTRTELRALDIEARSRRNNLLFYNIPENDNESGDDCVAVLLNFLNQNLKLRDDEIDKIAMQRVHRLGFKRRGVAPDGRAWRPRPIIVAFRDFSDKELILVNAKRLKGSAFSIQQDFPPEIKAARGELWEDFRKAKSENKVARIVYPAKLVIDGIVEKDMFPEWNKWATGKYVRGTHSRNPQFPSSVSPMNIPMADLISVPEFRPRPGAFRDPANETDTMEAEAGTPVSPSRPNHPTPRVTHGSSGGRDSRQDVSQDSQPSTGHQRTTATNEAPAAAADTREKTSTPGRPAGDENTESPELEPLAEAISSALNSTLDDEH